MSNGRPARSTRNSAVNYSLDGHTAGGRENASSISPVKTHTVTKIKFNVKGSNHGSDGANLVNGAGDDGDDKREDGARRYSTRRRTSAGSSVDTQQQSRRPSSGQHQGDSRAPPIRSTRSTRHSAGSASEHALLANMFEDTNGMGQNQAQLQAQMDASNREEDDAEGEPDDDAGQEQPKNESEDGEFDQASSPPIQIHKTRGGRTVRTKSLRESPDPEEDDFENSISQDDFDDDITPKTRSKAGNRTRNSLGGFVDHDEDENASEDSNGRPKRRLRPRAPPAGSRKGSRPVSRRRVKDDDYEQDDDEEDDDELGELLDGREETPALSDHSSDVIGVNGENGRSTRSRAKKAGGNRRRLGISTDSEEQEDQPIKTRLRERTNKVNYYMLPPSAALEESARNSNKQRRLGATASQSNGGFLMDMTRGLNALADPNMPNMPDSDSDDDPPDYIKDFRKEAFNNMNTMALANGGVGRGKKNAAGGGSGQGGVGPSTATVAAGTVGRFNPEAGELNFRLLLKRAVCRLFLCLIRSSCRCRPVGSRLERDL